MTLDLGIDAGGSKAAWLACDAAGTERARGIALAIQAQADDPAIVADSLVRLVREAEREGGAAVGSLVAGIAGAGLVGVRGAVRSALAAKLPGGIPIAIVGDVEVAAAACLAHAPGLAVWAGTGSFCVARSEDGALHRAGGRGLLLDDRGGAASIVLAAARLAVEGDDGVRPRSALCDDLARAFGAARARELGRVLRPLAAGELAAQLMLVDRLARHGDAAARAAFALEAAALAERAVAAVTRAGLAPAFCPVHLGGGALTHSVALRDALCLALRECGLVDAPGDAPAAVEGAAALAQAQRTGLPPLCRWLEDDRAA